MTQRLLRLRLIAFLLRHHARALLRGERTAATVLSSLRRQLVVSSMFRDAKYSAVGGKVFIDPFAPYFPSDYCRKLFENNSAAANPPRPNFAQISITNRCPCRCMHCHVENTQDADLPRETILDAIRQIARADFPLIFFVGGEPLSRFKDLLDFVEHAHQHMDTRIFTSGVGATPARLTRLRKAGLEGICVSLDHYDEAVHNARRASPVAFASACATIREASALGFYVSVVCCTTAAMVRSGETWSVVDLAESLGAHSIQLNEIRPVGRALVTEGMDLFLGPSEKAALVDFYRRANRGRRKIAIVMPWYNEEPDRFGCTATSGQQVYIDAKGNVQPCPLLKVSFGNIARQGFGEIWDGFRGLCDHPVRQCLVHRLAEELSQAGTLPLAEERTRELWPELCRLPASGMYERIVNVTREGT
jgi:MoaA/NifB/PqqE/SkfB family radical SAM enzyme